MIGFWKRAKSIGFILNQTTRSLKDRASLLKSRRRGQGHMSNISQERVNSSPQLVFRRHRRILCLRFPRGTNIRRCNRLRETPWPASKEEILEEMVAKSSDIDFFKSDKTSLKELTNSEFCETEGELD
jgi:hypothetical protein